MPLLPPGSRCTGWLPIGTAKRRLPADSLVAVSQPPPPPAYGYPQQPQPQPQTSSDAIVALVLAILRGPCPFVLAIVALIFASKASKSDRGFQRLGERFRHGHSGQDHRVDQHRGGHSGRRFWSLP